MEEKVNVVFVDDDPTTLLIAKGCKFDNVILYTFNNPEDCLKKLEEINPWVIISDQRMPQMLGNEFLKKAKEIAPKSIRIMLTGYHDEHVPGALINDASADAYLNKPISTETLEGLVEKYIEMFIQKNIISKYESVYGNKRS